MTNVILNAFYNNIQNTQLLTAKFTDRCVNVDTLHIHVCMYVCMYVYPSTNQLNKQYNMLIKRWNGMPDSRMSAPHICVYNVYNL